MSEEQEIKNLQQWKKGATELLGPLITWGQAQKDIPLGHDVTKEILRRAKLFSKYEKALKDIAEQKTCAETEADEDIPIGSDGKRIGDIEVGYDSCIETAREALTPKTSNDEQ